jgi:hypothetical protein
MNSKLKFMSAEVSAQIRKDARDIADWRLEQSRRPTYARIAKESLVKPLDLPELGGCNHD